MKSPKSSIIQNYIIRFYQNFGPNNKNHLEKMDKIVQILVEFIQHFVSSDCGQYHKLVSD